MLLGPKIRIYKETWFFKYVIVFIAPLEQALPSSVHLISALVNGTNR